MFWFLIIGVIWGRLAGKLIEGGGFGLRGDLAFGIVGSLSGGYLFRFFGISAYGISGEFIMATIGAILLLLIIRLFKGLPIEKEIRENT